MGVEPQGTRSAPSADLKSVCPTGDMTLPPRMLSGLETLAVARIRAVFHPLRVVRRVVRCAVRGHVYLSRQAIQLRHKPRLVVEAPQIQVKAAVAHTPDHGHRQFAAGFRERFDLHSRFAFVANGR